jgi:hypothetical protein
VSHRSEKWFGDRFSLDHKSTRPVVEWQDGNADERPAGMAERSSLVRSAADGFVSR